MLKGDQGRIIPEDFLGWRMEMNVWGDEGGQNLQNREQRHTTNKRTQLKKKKNILFTMKSRTLND